MNMHAVALPITVADIIDEYDHKIATLPEVDSMIMNRHVDHRDEGGLRLGVWRRNEASANPCEPTSKKKIYEIFRVTDTPDWEPAYAFALPVIGIKSWDELSRP